MTNDIPRANMQVVPLDAMTVYDGQQRPFDPRKLRVMMGKDFDPEAVGILTLSHRKEEHQPDRYHIMDGQHRVAALKQAGYTHWEADVREGLTRAREAELFAKFNENRTNLSALVKHLAWAEVGKAGGLDPRAVRAWAIEQAVTEHGFKVPNSPVPTPRAIGAIGALQFAYFAGGKELVDELLAVVDEAWGKHEERLRDGRQEQILRAITHVIAYHKEHAGYERDRLVEVLQEEGPRYYLAQARDIADRNPQNKGARAVYLAMVDRYNKGRRGASALRRQYRSLSAQSGERNKYSKLTNEQAEEIAELHLEGIPFAEIAARYEIDETTVRDIADSKRYTRTMDQVRYGKR